MKAVKIVLTADVTGLGVAHHRTTVPEDYARALFARGLAKPFAVKKEAPAPKVEAPEPKPVDVVSVDVLEPLDGDDHE